MKTQTRGPFPTVKWMAWLRLVTTMTIALLGLAGAPRLRASSAPEFEFSVLEFLQRYFDDDTTNSAGSNAGGAAPVAELLIASQSVSSRLVKASPKISSSSDVLYGTASLGGSSEQGTIFSIHSDGTGFTLLHYVDWLHRILPKTIP